MGTLAPPPHASDFVTVLLSPSLVRALEQFIVEQMPGQTRSFALRDAFRRWCIDEGYLKDSDIDHTSS